MSDKRNKASGWRIEMAEELSQYYSSHEEVVMVCLGGSSSKGIADAYSDLDIIVYWNNMDEDWIQSSPLDSAIGLARTDIISMAPGSFVESYHLEGVKIDFGHVSMKDWEEWSTPLTADPDQIGMVGGFLGSIPFYGRDLFNEWKGSLGSYPDEIAVEIIKRNLGFYVKGYLLNQCFNRGDLLAYSDGMNQMLKKLINVAAALNRRFYSAAEPRWIQYELQQMPLLPEKLSYRNICWMFENPGAEAESMLYSIQEELMDMVADQFPELAEKVEKRKFRISELAVTPCEARPVLPVLAK